MTFPARFTSWMLDDSRASYGLAVMRMALGGMTMLTLALSAPHLSYTFGRASRWVEGRTATSSVHDYFWPLPFPFSNEDDTAVLYVKVAAFFLVAAAYTLGWHMRIVSPLFVFLWLGFSTLNPLVTNAGHYQTFRVMLIFLLFADLSRRWSLDARRRARGVVLVTDAAASALRIPRWFVHLLNNTAVILVGFQVCMIYVVSALWKLQGEPWREGYATYYPLRLEELTLFPGLNETMWQMTPLVMVVTWVSVYLQLLFPILLLDRYTRMAALVCVTIMHAGIAVLLALPWFSLLMIAADMVFVREESWVKLRAVGRKQRDRWLSPRRTREIPQSSS